MCKQIKFILTQLVFMLLCLTIKMPDGYAQSSYGTTVDNHCLAYNGTKPYTAYKLTQAGIADKCTFCHQPSNQSKATPKNPEFTWWLNQLQTPSPLNNFCPQGANQPPNGSIDSPANGSTFNIGSPVIFKGSGIDPDKDTSLTYAWNFGGAVANSTAQIPSVTLSTAGTFTITLTVTDSLGLADQTPATISITVKDPTRNPPNGVISQPSGNSSIKVGDSISFVATATDPDNDTNFTYLWNFGGAAANSTLPSQSVTFNTAGMYTITLTATDSTGLSDPTPATRTITVGAVASACTDADGDKFSPEGGVCGPKDCDDFVKAINPGAVEACSDLIDNDCNGQTDAKDAQCNGNGDCIGQLLNQIQINTASWNTGERRLSVNGTWSTAGASVKLSDALTGAVLGTTTVANLANSPVARDRDREHEDEHEEHEHSSVTPTTAPSTTSVSTTLPWQFQLEHLAIVPCRVRVEIDGRIGERDVAYAPSNCSGKPEATNTPPAATPDSAKTAAKTAVKISVLANDSDAEHDNLSITVFTQPANGIVTKEDNLLVYAPKADYSGIDTFTYTITDGHGGTATAAVTVTVEKPIVPAIKVTISRAEWDKSDRKLLISGAGVPNNASVKIVNASTRASLGTTKAEDDGRWKFTLEKPAVVPCKVAVEVTKDGQSGSAERAVSNAPSTCK